MQPNPVTAGQDSAFARPAVHMLLEVPEQGRPQPNREAEGNARGKLGTSSFSPFTNLKCCHNPTRSVATC